jgi:hypothetical protein
MALSLLTSIRVRVRAQSKSCSSVSFEDIAVPFLMRPRTKPDAFGMPLVGTWGGAWAHQKGELARAEHVLSFPSPRPVTQPVPTWSFPMGASMEELNLQREFPLLARMEGPAIVPTALMRLATSYRSAVRLCWQLRRVRKMTFRQLAAECDLIYQHVGDYFNPDDKPTRRSLPGDSVAAIEAVLGNTAISQWHAANAKFTVLEVIQAGARA